LIGVAERKRKGKGKVDGFKVDDFQGKGFEVEVGDPLPTEGPEPVEVTKDKDEPVVGSPQIL